MVSGEFPDTKDSRERTPPRSLVLRKGPATEDPPVNGRDWGDRWRRRDWPGHAQVTEKQGLQPLPQTKTRQLEPPPNPFCIEVFLRRPGTGRSHSLWNPRRKGRRGRAALRPGDSGPGDSGPGDSERQRSRVPQRQAASLPASAGRLRGRRAGPGCGAGRLRACRPWEGREVPVAAGDLPARPGGPRVRRAAREAPGQGLAWRPPAPDRPNGWEEGPGVGTVGKSGCGSRRPPRRAPASGRTSDLAEPEDSQILTENPSLPSPSSSACVL
ncbi:hypothetical protein P7K49_028614 [Saguinus oedipus]|uniref:Uncharacterized protein n=1 Tax=Saguinus oedipus TaxID=9490 RepID=A0ABQ9U4V0_SAGOE|nr:hypothetical protein P7K49_028614 [Saguinus oedipus]